MLDNEVFNRMRALEKIKTRDVEIPEGVMDFSRGNGDEIVSWTAHCLEMLKVLDNLGLDDEVRGNIMMDIAENGPERTIDLLHGFSALKLPGVRY